MKGKNLGLDHLHIYVNDLEEAIQFYGTIGLEFIEYSQHGGKTCVMKVPNTNLLFEIQQTGVIENPGINHYAFLVDNLDELTEDLKLKGLYVDGPLISKSTGRRLATIRDSHGFLVQLVQTE
ncbi:VOC family protein [Candidatus Bathyarchaeota archaeon]|nr:VOC family protein [Candidatus Bathyarchaeota archaeon]